MDLALSNDINKMYLEAVNHYENVINSEFHNIESFANLAFLYWAFAAEQFEFNIPNKIPDAWSKIGGERFLSVIDKGLHKYPNNVELNFWKQYFLYRLYMTEFSENECKNLLKKYGDGENLVPYFFLHLFDRQKYKDKISKLLENCIDKPSAKNIYIQSFI